MICQVFMVYVDYMFTYKDTDISTKLGMDLSTFVNIDIEIVYEL